MKQHKFVVFKDPSMDGQYTFDPYRYANAGETPVSVVADLPYPDLPPELVVTIQSLTDFNLSGGEDGLSYGCTFTITMNNGRLVKVLLAVVVQTPSMNPEYQQDPSSFLDLVGEIQAGNAAIGVATFVFDPTFDPTGGIVEWRMLDNAGQMINGGNAFDYQIHSNGISNIVRAQCVIAVPSDVRPSNFDEKYQVQYILHHVSNDGVSTQQTVAENLSVIGLTTTPLGPADVVELTNSTALMTLVTDQLYSNVQSEVQLNNETVGTPLLLTDYQRVDSGYMWGAGINTAALPVSIEPYVILWSYWNQEYKKYREYSKLFVVNTSILDAINDVQARVNKARTTLYGTPDMLFPPETVMLWLRRGGDYFNGYGGLFTSFNFTNAKGIVREYWLQCAEMMALESQELAEGEKAFNYSGAAISLDVDRTAAYGAAADKIRSRLETDLRPVKINLINKGNDSGDGSGDVTMVRRGAMGSVGWSLTPASVWATWPLGFPRFR